MNVGTEKQALVKHHTYPECSLCGMQFNESTMEKCYHFSGIRNGKEDTHMHVCGKCLDSNGLTIVNFDELV